MYTMVTKTMFINDMYGCFTPDAAEMLFDYLERFERESGVPIEYDAIALRCEFSQSTLDDFNADYGTAFETVEELLESDHAENIAVCKNDVLIVHNL